MLLLLLLSFSRRRVRQPIITLVRVFIRYIETSRNAALCKLSELTQLWGDGHVIIKEIIVHVLVLMASIESRLRHYEGVRYIQSLRFSIVLPIRRNLICIIRKHLSRERSGSHSE